VGHRIGVGVASAAELHDGGEVVDLRLVVEGRPTRAFTFPRIGLDNKQPQVADLGFHYRAGDENRTRALSLGSDGAWVGWAALTCADTCFLGGRVGRIAPLLTLVLHPNGHKTSG